MTKLTKSEKIFAGIVIVIGLIFLAGCAGYRFAFEKYAKTYTIQKKEETPTTFEVKEAYPKADPFAIVYTATGEPIRVYLFTDPKTSIEYFVPDVGGVYPRLTIDETGVYSKHQNESIVKDSDEESDEELTEDDVADEDGDEAIETEESFEEVEENDGY